ncbi:hypothetical protein [Waddlia chondrophila]|uniref:Uncharacterized protein n=1 Tax=Waddlia chondrophila (strain ATCC VR-1470 / WSU 86-1044) TaxID=716544 RepID=D6YV05_WADCW|nr:hypothetical protein [Waddlia chondrophila]ADI37966.1 conserved hypothetical protein [Waddlia chondrophila WSU 86-1044]
MKPIDFQGIANFDKALLEHLHAYLSYSESQLAKSIIYSIHPLPGKALPLVLPQLDSERLRSRDAVQSFGKSVAMITQSDEKIVASNDWESASRQLNGALWEYVEILEGCATELFQQLNQVGFEQWRSDLMNIVEQVKQSLLRQMKECEWLLNRMEPLLKDYRKACQKEGKKGSFWKSLFGFRASMIDRSLYSYLRKSRRFLHLQFKWFSQRLSDYQKLKEKIEKSSRKFKSYHAFAELDESVQKDFKKLYELLKLWNLNQKTKSLPPREPIRALRSLFSLERAKEVFSHYFWMLEEALYEKSRAVKTDPADLYRNPSNRQTVAELVKGMQAEVHTLGATIEGYRDFDLRTHPDPYVRNRWGFTEWVVGPEPEKTRELLDLVYEVELLGKLFERFSASLNKEDQQSDFLYSQYEAINRTLHEMGQPLSSRVIMRARAERLLEQVDAMDELGSFNLLAIDYAGRVFSKAMRADWQYNVLFEIPQFHHLYRVHHGLVGKNLDQKHLSRLNKFKEIIEELQGWVKKCDTHRHVHEIEADMNDMKGYLQDFLGFVQRVCSKENLDAFDAKNEISEIFNQLLEYRYLFGSFFHMLLQHEPEGKLIRNQFLFVDQYFEAVESQLHEMQQKWRLPR